jgi:hypothetical protein
LNFSVTNNQLAKHSPDKDFSLTLHSMTAMFPLCLIGLAGNPASRDSILGIHEFGHLIEVDLSEPSQRPSLVTDIASYEKDNNPDGGDLISNLYSLAIQDNTIYVTDAGGNALYTIGEDGTIQSVTVIPRHDVPNPIPGQPNPLIQAVATRRKGSEAVTECKVES